MYCMITSKALETQGDYDRSFATDSHGVAEADSTSRFEYDDRPLTAVELEKFTQNLLHDARQVVGYDAFLAQRTPETGYCARKNIDLVTAKGQRFTVHISYIESAEKGTDGRPLHIKAELMQLYDWQHQPVPTEQFTTSSDIAWSHPERPLDAADSRATAHTGIWAEWYNPSHAENDPAYTDTYYGEGMGRAWNSTRAAAASKALLSQLLPVEVLVPIAAASVLITDSPDSL